MKYLWLLSTFTVITMIKNTILLHSFIFLVTISLLSCKSSLVPGEKLNSGERIPLADPFILLYDDVYYAYGTGSADGIAVMTSKDLTSWKKMPKLALHKNDSYGEKWFWAPEVYHVNGRLYVLTAEEHILFAVSTHLQVPSSRKFKTDAGGKSRLKFTFIDD